MGSKKQNINKKMKRRRRRRRRRRKRRSNWLFIALASAFFLVGLFTICYVVCPLFSFINFRLLLIVFEIRFNINQRPLLAVDWLRSSIRLGFISTVWFWFNCQSLEKWLNLPRWLCFGLYSADWNLHWLLINPNRCFVNIGYWLISWFEWRFDWNGEKYRTYIAEFELPLTKLTVNESVNQSIDCWLIQTNR